MTDHIHNFGLHASLSVCDQHLDLCKVETVPWAPRTSGERLVFLRCAKCGIV
jgi:hypothetical protein